jgi:hypothetical protein
MLNPGRTGPHSPEQRLAETAAPDGRGERRQRQLLKVVNGRNRPTPDSSPSLLQWHGIDCDLPSRTAGGRSASTTPLLS